MKDEDQKSIDQLRLSCLVVSEAVGMAGGYPKTCRIANSSGKKFDVRPGVKESAAIQKSANAAVDRALPYPKAEVMRRELDDLVRCLNVTKIEQKMM